MFRMRRTATVNLYPLFSETRRLELQTGEGKSKGRKNRFRFVLRVTGRSVLSEVLKSELKKRNDPFQGTWTDGRGTRHAFRSLQNAQMGAVHHWQ